MGASDRKSLLFLDDERDVLEVMSEVLRRSLHRVVATTEAEEAMKAFSEDPQKFDAVILNYTLTGTTGLDVARTIRSVRQDVPIILFTGVIWADIKDAAERQGITEYLSKPATVDELHRAVKRVCLKAKDR